MTKLPCTCWRCKYFDKEYLKTHFCRLRRTRHKSKVVRRFVVRHIAPGVTAKLPARVLVTESTYWNGRKETSEELLSVKYPKQ